MLAYARFEKEIVFCKSFEITTSAADMWNNGKLLTLQ